MSEQRYSLRVIDYGLPSFCSGDQYYYGPERSIMTLLEKNYEDGSDVLQAAKDYFSGRGARAASLYGEKPLPLITPVEVIGTSSYARNNVNFRFHNIYGWPTDIVIKHLKGPNGLHSRLRSKVKTLYSGHYFRRYFHRNIGRYSSIYGG